MDEPIAILGYGKITQAIGQSEAVHRFSKKLLQTFRTTKY